MCSKIQPSTKEHALVSSIDLRSTYHTIAFGKRTGFLYRPTLDIPANIYNTMSSFSELLLGLSVSIEESTEWPVAIPFASSHYILDTNGVVTPTPFSSLSCSMVNLVLCMDRSKHGFPKIVLC